MKTERTKNSIYNGIANLLINISVAILSFLVRTIFVHQLGEECLGLDGLFTNILSMLSLAELGFSAAVSFSLYEPLAKKDIKKINRLVSCFKKMYRLVSIFVLVIGFVIFPFLKFMVKDYTIEYNIHFIFILYLINTSFSYLICYNSILLEADQKNYKIAPIKFLFNLVVYGLQIFILIYTSNFVLYLLTEFVFRFIERTLIFVFIKRQYSNIDFNCKEKLKLKEKQQIKTNIKALILHRLGSYAVNGTDNILISSIINISMTGIYSNYLSIVSILKNLLNAITSGTLSIFGNLNVLEDEKTKENSFNILNFICYSLSGLIFVCLFFCFNPFIKIWLGEKFLLSNSCVLLICVNFYLNALLLSVDTIKYSAGLYYVDRFVPIIQAIINLGISVILGIKMGIIGILLGTTISSILTINITKPYVIYKKIFKTSPLNYYKKILKNICIIILTIAINLIIFKIIKINSHVLIFIVYGIFSVIVYSLIFLVTNFKSREFNYLKKIMFK